MLDLPTEQQEMRRKKQHSWSQACYSKYRQRKAEELWPDQRLGAARPPSAAQKQAWYARVKGSGAGATKMTKPRAVARLTVTLARAGDGVQQEATRRRGRARSHHARGAKRFLKIAPIKRYFVNRDGL